MACSTASESSRVLTTERYPEAMAYWPSSGRHILAQCDSDTVVVYQAYKADIADFAVENQRFGGPVFSLERMSWIKTNFLWMMYRSSWATKANQERILAVWLTKAGFEEILSMAYTAQYQKNAGLSNSDVEVRLQWDPDHTPTYENVERKAIQLGLKGNTLRKYTTEWIVQIKDITDFVREQHRVLKTHGMHKLLTPIERVYQVTDFDISRRIGVDEYVLSNVAFVP